MTQQSIADLGAAVPPPAVELIGRWRIATADPLLDLAEWTATPKRIRGSLYQHATLRGVPGRHADMIVAARLASGAKLAADARVPVLEVTDRPDPLGPAWHPVLEVATKAGRYDGRQRRRYALRVWMRPAALRDLPLAHLRVIQDDPEWLEIIIAPTNGPAIIDRWPRLRHDLSDYNLARVAGWQWRHFFTHLTDQEEIRAACDAWAAEAEATGESARWTLSEANRAASSYLYRLSRDLGWRKLTRAEKDRLGIDQDSPQWWRESDLLALYAAKGHYDATGCGEATLTAASQGHWPAMHAPPTDAEALELEFDEAYPMR